MYFINRATVRSDSMNCCRKCRKYVVSLFFMFASLTSFAQTDSLHLTFKGIPIDGPIHEFIQKMANVGFTYDSKTESTFFFKGHFAGVSNCIISVSPNSANIVNCVAVAFPDYNDWESVEANYYYIKSLLSKKYGEPYACTEEFGTDVPPTEDKEKMYCLRTKKGQFFTLYQTYKGYISISITSGVRGVINVFMLYQDRINSNAIKENDVLEDL